MIFSQDRGALRRMYAEAWAKREAGDPMSALERQIAEVVAEHPEYLDAVTAEDIDRDYLPEGGQTNPFLHMGMHISLGEQLLADRPAGLRDLYQRIANRLGDPHAAEHAMMDCLGVALWEAQRSNRAPDEAAYLECLRKLAG